VAAGDRVSDEEHRPFDVFAAGTAAKAAGRRKLARALGGNHVGDDDQDDQQRPNGEGEQPDNDTAHV
jgi:hypothetical protein